MTLLQFGRQNYAGSSRGIENANDSVMRTVERLGARSRLTAAPLPLE
jgi:hypothetical protein